MSAGGTIAVEAHLEHYVESRLQKRTCKYNISRRRETLPFSQSIAKLDLQCVASAFMRLQRCFFCRPDSSRVDSLLDMLSSA